MPKGRYKIMREYMPKRGKLGLDMMLRTCTVQTNLGFLQRSRHGEEAAGFTGAAADRHRPLRRLPFTEGKPNGIPEFPAAMSGPTPIPTAAAPALRLRFRAWVSERYVDFMLDVLMYFVYRDGEYVDASGQSFRAFAGHGWRYPPHLDEIR